MPAYYNEIDPFAVEWLKNLIHAGLIAPGDVDDRSITDVQPSDLAGYTQCHFFAGIGGWSHALRLAGWPDDRPVWTGSCPCQSFSNAGKQLGFSDPRHLWPHWFRLIRKCKPPVLFGEQVEGAVRHGWLDLVQGDLERESYACGTAVLGAHSVGAPHIRQRLWFVARLMGDTLRARLEGRSCDGRECAGELAARSPGVEDAWRVIQWLSCCDGKSRATQPGLQPLANGVSGRVGCLRAYGNAIVPELAAAFIRASEEALRQPAQVIESARHLSLF